MAANTTVEREQERQEQYEMEQGRGPGQREGFLETCVSTITSPVATLRRVTHNPPIGWAIVLIIGAGVISGILQALLVATGGYQTFNTAETTEVTGAAAAVLGIGMAVATPIMAVVGLAVLTGIYWVLSRLLGGQGSYSGLFAVFSFAGIPSSYLAVPILLLGTMVGTLGYTLAWAVTIPLTIWSIALGVIAIRENNAFTTIRAVVAFFIPLVLVVGLLIGVVVLIIAAIAAATTGA